MHTFGLPHMTDRDSCPEGKTGWRLLGLYFYCVLLTALAAAFASAFVISAYWTLPAP